MSESELVNRIYLYKMPLRKITTDEERLLDHLIGLARLKLPQGWKENLMVEPMDDAGMGSLLLHPNGQQDMKRIFGSVLSEYEFKDVDRATVIVSLNADQHGQIFELDVWKTTFEPLKAFPTKFS